MPVRSRTTPGLGRPARMRWSGQLPAFRAHVRPRSGHGDTLAFNRYIRAAAVERFCEVVRSGPEGIREGPAGSRHVEPAPRKGRVCKVPSGDVRYLGYRWDDP